MVLPEARSGLLHAAVEHGHFGIKVHRSSDGGVKWEEKDVPSYPEKPEGVPDLLDPHRQVPVPWSLEKVWALEAGGWTNRACSGAEPFRAGSFDRLMMVIRGN